MLTAQYYKKHQHVANQTMQAIVQSHSQSQAKLMFVTIDNFDCTKMNLHFKNSQLWKGSFKVKTCIASPPPPYDNLWFSSTHNEQKAQQVCMCSVVPTINCVSLFKPTQSLEALGHGHLAIKSNIRPWDLGLPNSYSLDHCGISAASRHKLAFTSILYSLLVTPARHCITIATNIFLVKIVIVITNQKRLI